MGYNARWERVRRAFIRVAVPRGLCGARLPGLPATGHSQCATDGRVVAGEEVDHVVPHRGDPHLLYDPTNLQWLCRRCHGRKTAVEDGGFGNPCREGADRIPGGDRLRRPVRHRRV